VTTLSEGTGRNRAIRPGSGRVRAAVAATFAVLVGVLAYGVYGYVAPSGQGHLANPAKWVPKQERLRSPDQLIVGTYAHPAVTVAGDDVRVETPTFSALADVTGPLVPGEGLSYQPQYVTGTWTVHIWDVKGDIPLSAADFDSVDFVGTEFHLKTPLGATMPKAVSTGQQVSFQLRAVVPIGEDLFRWAPNGNNIVAKWDNQVEND
jgi:hypothetical protein